MEWLVERNKQNLETEVLNVNRIRTLPNHSKVVMYLAEQPSYFDIHGRQIFYGIPQLTSEIDCMGSFNHHKATPPYKCQTNETGTIKISFFDKSELVIDPCNEIFVDAAVSMDERLFATISAHCAMVWNIHDHNLISKIECPNHVLDLIVALNQRSVVLQDTANTIFACDLIEKNEHMIYSNSEWATIYPIAFADHYIFLHTQTDRQKVKITTMTDIIALAASLHFDQIKLLSWLYKAALTGNKLNLTSDLPGIIHAKQVLHNLPKPMRLLMQQFVKLPTREKYFAMIDSCAIS